MPFANKGIVPGPSELFGQDVPSSITVRAVDASTGEPIADAVVQMTYHGPGFSVPVVPDRLTGADGQATFRRTSKLLRLGRHEASVNHPLYERASLSEMSAGENVVRLERAAAVPVSASPMSAVPLALLLGLGLAALLVVPALFTRKRYGTAGDLARRVR
jgi:hypothetical protein